MSPQPGDITQPPRFVLEPHAGRDADAALLDGARQGHGPADARFLRGRGHVDQHALAKGVGAEGDRFISTAKPFSSTSRISCQAGCADFKGDVIHSGPFSFSRAALTTLTPMHASPALHMQKKTPATANGTPTTISATSFIPRTVPSNLSSGRRSRQSRTSGCQGRWR